MAFLGLISAILFFGAVQQWFMAIQHLSLAKLLMTSTLTLLVFNGAIDSSHYIEQKKTVEYKLDLMIIDLVNFLLLSFAIVVLNPELNIFGANFTRFHKYVPEAVFWIILMLYWELGMLWTFRAGNAGPDYPAWRFVSSRVITALFGLQAIATVQNYDSLSSVVRAVVLLYLTGHVVFVRSLHNQGGAKNNRSGRP